MFLSEPFRVAMIACPGVYCPQINASGRLAAHHVQQLEQKLDLILKLTACFGHDSIILGAMGCGNKHRCTERALSQVSYRILTQLLHMQHGKTLQQRWQPCLRVCYKKTAGDCSHL